MDESIDNQPKKYLSIDTLNNPEAVYLRPLYLSVYISLFNL